MGISLKPLLTKYFKELLKPTSMSIFAGQTWAVDASIYCYKFLYSSTEKNKQYINGFKNMFKNFQSNGITPILVFDGCPPEIKKHTIQERNKIEQSKKDKICQLEELKCKFESTISQGAICTSKIDDIDYHTCVSELSKAKKNVITFPPNFYTDIKQICTSMNVQYLTARGEADGLCAKLFKDGKVQCVLSEDTDLLMFGCSLARKYNYTSDIEYINITELLSKLNLTQTQFIDVCILSGTDYTKHTIPSVGPMTSYKFISSGMTIEDICKKHNVSHLLNDFQCAKTYVTCITDSECTAAF
jgi:flap endonuclease-1